MRHLNRMLLFLFCTLFVIYSSTGYQALAQSSPVQVPAWTDESQAPGAGSVLMDPGTSPGETVGKDVVFLLDLSGSMVSADRDRRIKEAIGFCLDRLGQEDNRAGLVPFSDRPCPEFPLTELTDQGRGDLINYLESLSCTQGDTDLGSGLTEAVRMLQGSGETGRDRRVLLISDGVIDLPKEEHEDQAEKDSLTRALLAAESARQTGILIQTLGISNGTAMDENLLTYLADRTGGSCQREEAGTDLNQGMLDLIQAPGKPLPKETEETDPAAETTQTETEERGETEAETGSETEKGTEESTEAATEGAFGLEEGFGGAGPRGGEGTGTRAGRTDRIPSWTDRLLGRGDLTGSVPGTLLLLAGILMLAGLGFSQVRSGRRGGETGGGRRDGPLRRGGPGGAPGAEKWALSFYVRMEDQRIFGVPTQNRVFLPETRRPIRLNRIIEDPYLEHADIGRVVLRIGRDGVVLVTKTRECVIRDQDGADVRKLLLLEGTRFRIFCATDQGVAVIAAVLAGDKGEDPDEWGRPQGREDMVRQEDEKTRLLI